MVRNILLLFCAIFGVNSSPTENIVKCKQEDSACITKNANYNYQQSVAGVPELHMENLDPMYQPYIEADLTDIKYNLYNSTIIGFSECVIVDAQLDIKELTLRHELDCPYFMLTGKYEMFGHLLNQPIQGKGDYSIDCTDYHLRIDNDIEVSKGRNGKKYMTIKRYNVDADLRGEMVLNLENLFNGKNKGMAKIINSLIKTHQKPVAKLLQGPLFKANVKKIVKNYNKFSNSIPLSDMVEL